MTLLVCWAMVAGAILGGGGVAVLLWATCALAGQVDKHEEEGRP